MKNILAILGLIPCLTGCNLMMDYHVYAQEMEGKAELARAKFTREIAVTEAKAKNEAAQLLAEAEITRAKGVATANQIIGDSLKGNEAYLRYLWIDGLNHDQNQIIYIPTEAGLPILESGRIRNTANEKA